MDCHYEQFQTKDYQGIEKRFNILSKASIVIAVLFLAILNIVLIVFLKNYNFIFFSMYILQMACEEIKKDKVKEDIIKMLNVDI